MSKGNTTENDVVKFMFNNVAMPSYGSNLYMALHTADPGEAGNATTNEATYGSYARVAVSRDSGGFTVSNNQAQNTALVQFPQCTSGSETVTHVSITTASSGASQILYKGALTQSVAVSAPIQPQFNASAFTVTED